MLICKHCDKECKNDNSLRNHERTCPSNPDRQLTHFGKVRSALNWTLSNQYIKAASLGLPKPELDESSRKKLSEANLSRSAEWNKKNGEIIRAAVNKKVENGEWHTSLAKRIHYSYKGVDLHGKWELRYAQYLDENNIRWERCKTSFPYEFEGKSRRYTPDFYLPDMDEYIEIKGYKTEKDEAKWNQFPKDKKFSVLLREQLNTLGINTK